jgi:hypothetical protein
MRLQEAWNATHQEYAYSDHRSFRRAARQAVKAVYGYEGNDAVERLAAGLEATRAAIDAGGHEVSHVIFEWSETAEPLDTRDRAKREQIRANQATDSRRATKGIQK